MIFIDTPGMHVKSKKTMNKILNKSAQSIIEDSDIVLFVLQRLSLDKEDQLIIEKLNELDTSNIEPLTSIAETTLKLRKDEIKSKNIRDEILKNSPEDNKDFFVVPKVVE